MMSNRYPGPCATCRAHVAEGHGFAARNGGGRWVVYCDSRRCTTGAGAAVPPAPAAPTTSTLAADGTVRMPYRPDALPLLRAMPGARWDGGAKVWRVSVAPGDRARVLDLAAKLGLDVAPELLGDVRPAWLVERVERAAVAGAYPFQAVGVEFLALGAGGRLLADEMGLGKSMQALLALPAGAAGIVVCPASVKFNWRAETARWRPDLAVEVLAGRGSFRWPAAGQIVVLNPDILPELPDDEPRHADVYLVADEAHAYKSHRAARSKRIKRLAELCGHAWALTGTPLLGRPFDLWGVLSSFGLAKTVFGWAKFIELFGGHKNRWGGWEFAAQPLPEAAERLRRVMLRRRREEVLPDLPGKTRRTVEVNGLSRDLRERCDALFAEYAADLDDDELPPFSEFSALRAELAESRIPALVELVEPYEEAGEPVIVASAHRAPVEALGQREGWATILGGTPPEQRTDIVRRFQGGELRGLAMTIQAGGVGLTLTRASAMIFADLDWTPALNLQCEDRICRIGQHASACCYTILTSDHPLDRRVADLLGAKAALIEQAVEHIIATPAPRPPRAEPRDEPADEWEARMAEIRGAGERLERERRAARIGEYVAAHAGDELAITPALVGAATAALEYMLGRCDGARERDGEGFAKPDVGRSNWLAGVDLAEDETAARAAVLMLRHYPRQLCAEFPALFGGDE